LSRLRQWKYFYNAGDKNKKEVPMNRTIYTPAAGRAFICALISSIVLLCTPAAWSHGFAGKRFFPTTLVVEDPFVADEFSVLYRHIKEPGEEVSGPSVRNDSLDVEYSKTLSRQWGVSIAGQFLNLHTNGGNKDDGYSNVEVGTKYQLYTSAAHEALLSVGINAEIGDSGNASIGVESYSVYSPAVFFGKGFGDLWDNHPLLKPLAITGVIATNFPSKTRSNTEEGPVRNPITVSYGLTLQYNMQYLQSFVRDYGLGAPFNHLIPVVEFDMSTCTDRGCKGDTTATANPGLLWFGKSFQLGLGAQIPLNHRTGDDIGILALVHLFIDDLFPHSLGAPLFGR